jgi:hypothetical protein
MMAGRRHVHVLFAATVAVLAASIFMYRSLPVASIVAVVGSGTVAVIVLAHLGILASLIASFLGLRRLFEAPPQRDVTRMRIDRCRRRTW